MRIRVLGDFEVSVGPRTINDASWRLRKAASLVKLLALAEGHRLHREQAMDLLWPDHAKKDASNNLRGALHAARRTIDTAGGSLYLASEGASLVLCRESLWVDVDAYEEAAIAARHTKTPSAYQAAIELYAGGLLPQDRHEAWAEGRREELRRLYLELLAEMASLYEEQEDFGPSIRALQRAISEEPAGVQTHADLMRLYALSGRHREAMVQYERLRRLLPGEPAAATRRLLEEIRAGNDPPPTAGRPAAGIHGRHNLSASLTSFVGRGREIAEARRMLSVTRLLTLTGVGGSGKTRLAVEAARGIVAAYPDGVWLVELAPLSEPALVPQAVARVLGVREQPGHPLLQTLIQALEGSEMLLVVDNCEHLIQASSHLVHSLLSSCPRLRILATSREPLGVAGEIIRQVGPLSLPEHGVSSAEGLIPYDAVRLFSDRASTSLPDFTLAAGNAVAVTRICHKLDGIPLAIELAAARAGTIPLELVATRLEDSLDLLTAGSWSPEPRQQTLRATLDWSHGLLEEPEKLLFSRLAVFAGGWALEAAEAVVSGEGIVREEVLDLLGELVEKSLVVAEPTGDGKTRYRLLEPVRQYAHEKLGRDKSANRVQRRHAEWCLDLAEEAEKDAGGLGHAWWLPRLETEHDNLRAALGWSLVEGEDAELGLRMAGTLWLFWFTQGYSSEGRGWLEKAIALGGSRAARARALNGAGWIVLFLGDSGTAKRLLEECVILYRGLGDDEGLASSLNFLGFVALLGGREDIPVAALLEEVLVLKSRINNRFTVANTIVFAALEALLHRGEWEETVALHEEALAMFREIDDRWGMGLCLTNLGLILAAMGNHARATELLRELMHRSLEMGDKFAGQYSFFGLACVADSEGQTARAARLWGVSEAIREAAGFRLPHAALTVMKYESRLAAARALLGEAAFEAAWAEGRTMPLERAIEYALSERGPAPDIIPSQKRQDAKKTPILTRREEEVTFLVAQGLTNRQISQELSISERTAANHVARILRKLGLHSRAQIATRSVEYRLPEPDPDRSHRS
jgi:predicted ATPase/DNA-binding SARP family transcriptional activator/DNA-binding CsgD family transcriptional regulator